MFLAEDNDLKIATVSDSGRKDRGMPGTHGSLFDLKELIQVPNLQQRLVYPALPSPPPSILRCLGAGMGWRREPCPFCCFSVMINSGFSLHCLVSFHCV